MKESEQRTGRRRNALSEPVIVRAAIEILDAEGEDALTFRSLAARLSTGAGAIYHHVASKEEILAAAAARLVAAVAGPDAAGPSGAGLRELMLSVYDVIEAHPWLGGQLARAPWQPAVLLVFESVGERLGAAGVPERNRFDAASALLNYVLGAAGQQAAGARIPAGVGRTAFLEKVAEDWAARGGRGEFPFVHATMAQLASHDDRRQFAAGIDLILAGLAALPRTRPARS